MYEADALSRAKISATLSDDEASTLPVAVSTAYLGLYNIMPYGLDLQSVLEENGVGAYKGKAIFISGGSGSVGQTGETLCESIYTEAQFDLVIQFAKLSGFDYIITTTTASAKHAEYLKSLGATHIVDRDTPIAEIPAALKNIVGSLEIE